MRWLQWANIDLEHGLGGVEVHARSIARELKNLGIDAQFSQDPHELTNPSWDVIHTHGSMLTLPGSLSRFKRRANPKRRAPIRIHGLHGETLGRMKACGEWTWPGGYYAATREYAAVMQADLIFSDHPNLSIYQFAEKIGKPCVVLSNGWDPFDVSSSQNADASLPSDILRAVQEASPFWLFLGRGGDPVKGADLILKALEETPEVRLVAVPGQGFENAPAVIRTGVLTSPQVQTVLQSAQGLILPSRYEGLPLAVMEALGQGIIVVATAVGGLKTLPNELQGLVRAPTSNPGDLTQAIKTAQNLPNTSEIRAKRAQANRLILPSWGQIAKKALGAVQDYQSRTR